MFCHQGLFPYLMTCFSLYFVLPICLSPLLCPRLTSHMPLPFFLGGSALYLSTVLMPCVLVVVSRSLKSHHIVFARHRSSETRNRCFGWAAWCRPNNSERSGLCSFMYNIRYISILFIGFRSWSSSKNRAAI